MNNFTKNIFQAEILWQCRIAQSATKDLEKAIDAGFQVETWKAVQAILICAANISKMCWGSRGTSENGRKALRESLGITDSSPIRDTQLRNDFEHFDERFERWFGDGQNKMYAERTIHVATLETHGYRVEIPTEHAFHQYRIETGVVSFWDHEVHLPSIIEEILRILPEAQERAAEEWWTLPEEDE